MWILPQALIDAAVAVGDGINTIVYVTYHLLFEAGD